MVENVSIQDAIKISTKIFRESREKFDYSLEDISRLLNDNYGIRISSNMLGKVERNEVKMRVDVFLALMHFFDLKLKDINPVQFKEPSPIEKEILRLSSVNPDIGYILDVCVQNGMNFEFINHLRNVVKSSLPLIRNSNSKPPSRFSLRAASPKKKKSNN